VLEFRVVPQGAGGPPCSVKAQPPSSNANRQVERNGLVPSVAAEPGQVQNTARHREVESSKEVLLPGEGSLQFDLLRFPGLKGAGEQVIVKFVCINAFLITFKLYLLLSAIAEDVGQLNTHHPGTHKQNVVADTVAQVADRADHVVLELVFRQAEPLVHMLVTSQRISVEN